MTRRVAVIGGGASGLVAVKSCLDEGLEPVCFESSNDIGGLWRFKENPEPDRASIYPSVIINTSKEMSCYSDYPPPADYPNFMHNSIIMNYFRMYAEKFQLLKHIQLHTRVLQVKKRPDFAQSGQWDVVTENKDGQTQTQVFDAVMICTGHHCEPNLPVQDFPGIDTFTGKYFHSRDYKTPDEWRNKNAVVVGIGNSGGDIAVELGRVTKQLYLSTRRGSWILNRVGDNGMPFDLFFNRVFDTMQKILPYNVVCSLQEGKLNQRFDHALYNLRPKHRLFSQHPTVNDELPNRILSGTVQVKPNIRKFQGSSVEFDDGSVVDDVDLVVFATGYKFFFPFLASQVVSVEDNKTTLYKQVFPPELEQPTLAIIGLVQPLGSIMPISEMQARWVTRVFKGTLKLPSKPDMLKDIQNKKQAMADKFVTSQRHTLQVDFIGYMDEIARLVGVRPNFLKLLLTDPKLALSVMFGPGTPYQYRLRGPGQWPGARQAILTQWQRVAEPMQTRTAGFAKVRRSLMRPVMLVTTAIGLAAYANRSRLPAFLQEPAATVSKIRAYVTAR